MRATLSLSFASLMAAACAGPGYAGAQTAHPLPRDVATEQANKALVINFYEGVFNRHQVAQATRVIADNYIQHNPHVPDGKAPFVNYFTEFFKTNPESKAAIVQSAVDGDLVWLHVRSTDGPHAPVRAIVDIFRVDHGRIVEHWDVIQTAPDHAANTNTMF